MVRRPILLLALLPALAGGAWAAASPADPPPAGRWAEDRIEVRLRPAAAAATRALRATAGPGGRRVAHARIGLAGPDALAAAWPGLRFERLFRDELIGDDEAALGGFWRVALPPGLARDEAIARFRSLPEVESAEPIALLPAAAVPNDSLWSVATWFYQPSRRDLHAPEAWDVTTGDPSIVVGILDSGVLAWHPDLETQIWTNPDEIPANGVDDDLDGYVDDVHGWDFVDRSTNTNIPAGEDWAVEDPDPSDYSGHGTKVAGIVGAATNNTIGVAGTAWNVMLMPLRVSWTESPGGLNGVVDMSYAAEALLYATRKGAAIVNCSFATANSGGLLAAATVATRAGVVIVSAAGNGGAQHVLGDREDVIAVAATDANDIVAAFSNVGPFVDLSAPGVGVHSTYVQHAGSDSVLSRQPDYNFALNGTSFAAPFASGAAALVQSREIALGGPPLSPMDMLFRLRETTDDITALNSDGTGYGTGRLDLHRALTERSTSRAVRTGARSVGPAVVLPARSGHARVYVATTSNRLLALDGTTRDTLFDAGLPGRPARQLAAADLGGGRGVGLFTGTTNGRVAGCDGNGVPLAGWPVTGPSGTAVSMNAGPALGDLDGDGDLEVVCGDDLGTLSAWNADGSMVTGFPVAPITGGFGGAVALADLDGVPGMEIVAFDRSGGATAMRGDGSILPGWPVAGGLASSVISPVVARLGLDTSRVVLAPIAGGFRAYEANGTTRWDSAPGGTPGQEPAVGDLDGDGAREIAFATAVGSLHRLWTVDTLGVVRATRAWPETLGAALGGPPLIGPLGPSGGAVLVFRANSLLALDDSSRILPAFPKPGLAGAQCTIAELDGDAIPEVVAGIGPDSLLYLYDAGAGVWPAPAPSWLTVRANPARTGSLEGAPPVPTVDDLAPAAIADLALDSLGVTGVALRWTAPGDDGTSGTAKGYELQLTTVAGDAGQFTSGVRTDLAPPAAGGTGERFVATALLSGTPYWAALRARDPAGNAGAASNVVAFTTAGPPPPVLVAALATRGNPSGRPVTLAWSAPAGGGPRRIALFDVGGRRVKTIALPGATSGLATWNGRDDDGHELGAGLYLARLEAGGGVARARVVLVP